MDSDNDLDDDYNDFTNLGHWCYKIVWEYQPLESTREDQSPEFKRSIIRASSNILLIRGDINRHNFTIMPLKSLKRLPSFIRPDLGMSIALLKLNIGKEISVSGNRVQASPFPQVPNFASIIITGSDNLKPVWRKINPEDALGVSVHEHDTPSGPQIPDTAKRVMASSSSNTPVDLKADAVDSFRVTFLVKNFLLLLQVPEPPGSVVAASAQESSGGMKRNPGDAFVVALQVS
ncbi:Protein of unknown function [Cotesia congregata]|uniref:Uncharacterized protein n=1 Tax=Cotesia congregata TaxID=51543 RepID=A0A8J2H2D3_COTCN|nr:Protein of unknown function [Cotesia congregata]